MLTIACCGVSRGQAAAPSPNVSPEESRGSNSDQNNHFGDFPADPGPIATDLDPTLNPDAIKKIEARVADWQLARARPYFNQQWTFGALYGGFLAASTATGDLKYHDAMLALGEGFKWRMQGGGRGGFNGGGANAATAPARQSQQPIAGNSEALGQTYLDLYLQYKNPWMLEPTQTALDSQFGIETFPAGGAGRRGGRGGGPTTRPGAAQATRMPPDAGTDPTRNPHHIIWWWCDALYMAPPAWARMYKITGDKKYLDYIDHQWSITSGYLYDTEEHLYYRDASHIPLREANGKKLFWSRGEGWVMGGLARTLEDMPDDYAPKAKYVAQFKEMAAKLASLQGDDGLWRAGLLDPDFYGEPENSGSSFITYAMTWGMNAGILDKATYVPVVKKAWKGLVSHIHQDGRLDCIQQTGSAPAKFATSSSYVYGVGAFLLAGREMNILSLTLPPELRN
jgi:rhamnogalacturonyl hydrolase YesR